MIPTLTNQPHYKTYPMEFQLKVGIQAESKPKAEEIITALLSIKNSLSDADLIALAKLLKTNPGIIETAKKFIG